MQLFLEQELDTTGGLYISEGIWQWVFATLYEDSRAKPAVISGFWACEEFEEYSSSQDVSSVQRQGFEFTIKTALKQTKKKDNTLCNLLWLGLYAPSATRIVCIMPEYMK